MSVPSLDTGVCQTQTRMFNKNLEAKQNAIGNGDIHGPPLCYEEIL